MATLNQTLNRIYDVNLSSKVHLAAADAANDYTSGIDTRGGSDSQPVNPNQTVNYRGNAARERMEAVVAVDATATLVDTKSMTFGIQDSDDDSSYAAIDGLTTQVVTGTTGNVSAATELRWKLPAHTRRYVRAYNNNPADGGDNTAAYFTLFLAQQ